MCRAKPFCPTAARVPCLLTSFEGYSCEQLRFWNSFILLIKINRWMPLNLKRAEKQEARCIRKVDIIDITTFLSIWASLRGYYLDEGYLTVYSTRYFGKGRSRSRWSSYRFLIGTDLNKTSYNGLSNGTITINSLFHFLASANALCIRHCCRYQLLMSTVENHTC